MVRFFLLEDRLRLEDRAEPLKITLFEDRAEPLKNFEWMQWTILKWVLTNDLRVQR